MIKAFCCFYNEAALIPFFLRHYHYVAAIEAFVSPSLDATRELLAADPRVTIRDVLMPDGMDDDRKVGWLNSALQVPDPDHAWHLVVDADEFLWPPGDPIGTTAAAYLASVPAGCKVLLARMAQIYRHTTDTDLDPDRAPVALQRRHGVAAADIWVKPIVLRANAHLTFTPGNHALRGGAVPCPTHAFEGAHWQNADPAFAVTRRIRDRKERQSAINRYRHHGTHHWTLTAAEVAQELEAHRDDPQLF